MYSNFRRAAQSSVKQITFQAASATSYSTKRKAMISKLSTADQHILEQIVARTSYSPTQARTETDVFLVLRGINPGKSGRAAVETDSAPRIVASEIIGLDKFDNTMEFGLPLRVVHDPEWRQLVPDFNDWILTAGRYPTYNESTDYCLPQKQVSYTSGMKQPSEIDKLEVYFGYLSGTLDEYWKTGHEKHIKHLWAIVHTIRSIVDDQIGQELTLDKFAELVEKRDASHADAVQYKATVAQTKPSAFYRNTLDSMEHRHELVHKSRFMNLDYLLLGMMTMNNGHDLYQQKSNHILRTILERTIKHATHHDMRNFLDRDQLIEFVQTSVGGRIESSLRWWAFLSSVLQRLLLGTVYGLRNFGEILQSIRNEIKTFSGGLSGLALIISPNCEMQDEDLAEFVLNAAEADKSDKKYATLTLFDRNKGTPLLNSLLQTNLKRLEEAQRDQQARLEALQNTTKQDKITVSSAEETNVHVPWTEFKTNCLDKSHVGDPIVVFEFIRSVVALSSDGTRLKAVQYMCQQATSNRNQTILGIKRLKSLISRFAPTNSLISSHYHTLELQDLEAPKRNLVRRLIYDLYCSYGLAIRHHPSNNNVASSSENDQDTTPATFVKFELARQMTKDYQLRMAAMGGQDQFECCVCLMTSKSVPVVLHGEFRHAVCAKCEPRLKTCPICRANL